jgi:hypothetical protein
MSLEHLTTIQQGLDDNLRIGCYQTRCNSNIMFQSLKLPITTGSRYSNMMGNINNTTGTGEFWIDGIQLYSWTWISPGICQVFSTFTNFTGGTYKLNGYATATSGVNFQIQGTASGSIMNFTCTQYNNPTFSLVSTTFKFVLSLVKPIVI